MKVLFLDVDGVLNTNTTPTDPKLNRVIFNQQIKRNELHQYFGLEPKLVDRYMLWLKDKDCEVVLSSDWRRYEETQELLNDWNIYWLDTTPIMQGKQRGIEIAWWLNQHPEVSHAAILDDNQNMNPVGRLLVQTSAGWGLQDKHFKKINKLLGYE